MTTTRASRLIPRRRRDSRGAALVEFALIMPLFAMLLFGMLTAGLALNEKQQMTHATREGARYASTIAWDQTFSSGTWASNVRDIIVERSVGTLAASDICVSLVRGSAGSAAPNNLAVITPANNYSTAPGNAPCIAGQTYAVTGNDTGLRVQVTATKPAEIDLILFGQLNVTMDAKATARSEDDL